MSESEKTVTNISIRATYDSLGDVLGPRARDMIFRNAGMGRVLESVPDYTWEKNYTNAELVMLYYKTVDLVGVVGAQGILRQMGYTNAEKTDQVLRILDQFTDLSPKELLYKGFELLKTAINRGDVENGIGDVPQFNVHDCTMCRGVVSRKPYCSPYAGALQYFTDRAFGRGEYLVIETKCKAKGDDTCLFELRQR
ncbi:MAG: 4-vinyl reductase [Deltaproteobacteria bacterium]|nr:4-vinyl reductase [Candidatus Zymogenaceae bacterium]